MPKLGYQCYRMNWGGKLLNRSCHMYAAGVNVGCRKGVLGAGTKLVSAIEVERTSIVFGKMDFGQGYGDHFIEYLSILSIFVLRVTAILNATETSASLVRDFSITRTENPSRFTLHADEI